MKLRLREDPREWRKSVWLTVLGLALLSSVLRWRKVLNGNVWLALLGVFALCALLAAMAPGWFRGFYRVSMRAGFALSQVVARVVLALVFVFLITPLGLLLRILGKDPLRLKRGGAGTSYWSEAKQAQDLERMF